MPPLAIAILIVGSRGDVQPFLPIAHRLQRDGHRVRIATHELFRDLVESHGIEFFPLAGDPRELMEFMVMTGGWLLPRSLDQLVEHVPRMRAMVAEILTSTWSACTQPDPGRPGSTSFLADAVIANPPSQGHIHVAEALCAPLHMMFTMPWSPTRAARHPLAPVASGAQAGLLNRLSFVAFDLLTWLGTGDLVNEFRERTLGAAPIHMGDHGASLLHQHAVPHAYLWSPSLLEKPEDWGSHLEVTGFVFPDEGRAFKAPRDLTRFLAAGPPPVYVGFGSCPAPDPAGLTRAIFDGLGRAGVRGLVSRGWAQLGNVPVPPHIKLVDDLPHDWLFPRCAAVCHHGGAGTTAAGLRAGRPTVVVPFFGDQYFWGRIVAEAGAGPSPIPIRELTASALAEAIDFCGREEVRTRARELGEKVRGQVGEDAAVAAFYRWLPLASMRCALDPGHLARCFCDDCDLRLCRTCDYVVHEDPRRSGHRRHPYGHVSWELAASGSPIERLQHALTAPLSGHDDEDADAAARRTSGVVLRDPGRLAAQLHAAAPSTKVKRRTRARILERFAVRQGAATEVRRTWFGFGLPRVIDAAPASSRPAAEPANPISVGGLGHHSESFVPALMKRLRESSRRVYARLISAVHDGGAGTRVPPRETLIKPPARISLTTASLHRRHPVVFDHLDEDVGETPPVCHGPHTTERFMSGGGTWRRPMARRLR